MSLFFERWYPAPLALLGLGVWYFFGSPFPKDGKEFLAAALSYAATLTGFLATAKAILMALPSDSVMKRIRSSGYLSDLVRYMAEAIYFCLAFCLANLIGFFFETEKLPEIYCQVWIFSGLLSTILFLRVARVMLKILEHA